jgi:hypothetical protein
MNDDDVADYDNTPANDINNNEAMLVCCILRVGFVMSP